MKVVWNIEHTIAVPLEKICYFEVIEAQKDMPYKYYILGYFRGNTGNFEVATAANKEACIKYINSLQEATDGEIS